MEKAGAADFRATNEEIFKFFYSNQFFILLKIFYFMDKPRRAKPRASSKKNQNYFYSNHF